VSKGAGKQQTTTSVDPQTQKFRQQIFDRANQVANQPFSQYGGPTVAGVDPNSYAGINGIRGAQGQFNNAYGAYQNFTGAPNMGFGSGLNTGRQFSSGLDPHAQFTNYSTQPYQQAGQTGAAALSGDQSAISKLMNPYQQNVVDAVKGQYDKLRNQSVMDVNDIATKGGAFGGDRQALLQGARLGELDQGQASTIADLLHGGYNDAMGQANSAANLGLGGGQLNLGQGQLGANYALGAGDQRLRGQQAGADWDMGVGNQMLQGQGLASQYNLGRSGQQLDAYGGMNQAAQGGLGAAGDLFNAGDYLRNVQQQGYDDAQTRFNNQRDWGLRGLGAMTGAMGGMPYGQTQSTPLTRNAGAGILGGAATGAEIGSAIPGFGTALGAGLGGILGLF
jgi:hypothetical protein